MLRTALAVFVVGLAISPAIAEKPPITARIVTAEQRKTCAYLGLVTVGSAMGWNKPKGALEKALRKAQAMGGNGLFIIGQTNNWAEGATINGEALKCQSL